ncbi:hypothetical protein Tco_1420105 [Tanacetum coccineum]
MCASVLDMSSDVMDGVPPSVATHASLHRDQLHATNERRRPQLGETHRNTRNPHYMSQVPAFRDVIDVPLVVRRLHKSRKEISKPSLCAMQWRY